MPPTLPAPDVPWRHRARRVVDLALPIILGMVSQNALNLIDTWMVGKCGPAALAAVSGGGMANFMFVATMMGLSAGVQALAARRQGEGRAEETAEPLNGALIMAVLVGVPLTGLFVPLVPALFQRLSPDPAVVEIGIPYLTARTLALTAAGINFSFRGFWNGTGRPHLYMITLVVVHGANIFLNWVLIFGNLGAPEYGAVGAGIASAVSTGLGAIVYVGLGLKHARDNGFLRRLPQAATLTRIAKLAAPTCLQQFLFAAGFTAQFWILGKLGTLETAAAGVLINVMLVAILPGLALGIAATSLVSEALGRGSSEEAARWGWDVIRVSLAVSALIALPMIFFPDAILGVFLNEPRAVEIARWPLRLFALGIGIDSAGTVLQQGLLGAGANRNVMLVSVFAQWGLFLPAAYVIGPVLGFGLIGIWTAQVGYRVLQALVYGWMWQQGRWMSIKI